MGDCATVALELGMSVDESAPLVGDTCCRTCHEPQRVLEDLLVDGRTEKVCCGIRRAYVAHKYDGGTG